MAMPLSSDAPAQSWTPYTPAGASFSSQNIVFRAIRADVAGTIIFTNQVGTSITRNMAAGEVWLASSSAILAITGGTATGIDLLG